MSKCFTCSGTGQAYGKRCTSCDGTGDACFPAGTLVDTPSGKCAIEAFQKGDEVLSVSMETGEVTVQQVRVRKNHSPTQIWELHMEGRSDPVRTTSAHTFYTSEGRKVVVDLKEGDLLMLHEDGKLTSTSITSVHAADDREPVYNLIVTGDGTFIADGAVVSSYTYWAAPRRIVVNFVAALEALLTPRPRTSCNANQPAD